jgi:DNA-directed RNA polymerase specialized sigma24 family protein
VIDLRFSPVGDQPVADAAIAGLLHGLSPHQIQVLLLRVVGGLTAEETAGLMREKAETIRLTEYEALQQIARRLQSEERVVG